MTDLIPLENLRLWMQELHDSERTVVCSPELESRVKTMVALSATPGLFDVRVMPGMADSQVIVVDHNAVEASTRQALLRRSTRGPSTSHYAADLASIRRDWMFGRLPSTLRKWDVSS